MPARSPRSKGRSTSKGRGGAAASATKKTPAKKAAVPAADKMDFEEGDNVMARWPGTTLFFKSKVTYVREDDNEYDVQFEDGTVYTLKAKEVKKKVTKALTGSKTPSRSRSRGRSPGRPKGSPGRPPKASPAASPSSTTRRSSRSAAFTAPRPDQTPTRQSARIAAQVDAVSDDDETHGKKAISNPSHRAGSSRGGKFGAFFRNLSFEWVGALFMMALFPLILISLHTLCTKTSCKPVLPFDKLPKTLQGYWDPQAFGAVVGFAMILRVLSFLPVGSLVRTAAGNEVRMNGFLGLLTLLAIMPALVYRKIDLSMVRTKYFYLMTASLVFAGFLSLVARLLAHFAPGKKSNVNAKGNTGNFIVDFFNGREFNPSLFGHDLKLQTFRFSMMGLAMINVAMTIDDIMKRGGQVNPVVLMASAFQVLYALDSMFFEEYYFFSHDAMNTGYGFSLVSSYNSFPFLPTLITKYLIDRQ
jgi:lamin-B receptor